ncbi:MAG: PQQ-binding-like beta-propeller repeat protein, partial [Candidatus Sericytochromatia bacterium]|nr:PQQ-binding-like beta-propeller repeat protein [Candidatus Sericytochromatia bacterium]
MRKSLNSILLTSLFLFACQPERANQYMAKYQFSGQTPDNKLMWNQIVDGKITTTPIMAEIWNQIPNTNNLKQNDLYMLFATSQGKLYNFEYRKANFKWTNSYESPIASSPAIYKDKAYFALKNNFILSIDVVSGKQLWKSKLDGEISGDPIVDDKNLYIGTKKGTFYSLDRESGKTNWHSSINGEINSTALIYRKMIYVGSSDGNLYALDISSGAIKWNFKTKGKIQTMPIAGNDNIYVISDDKTLSSLNAETGNFTWSYSLPKTTKSTPTLNVNRGVIYVAVDKDLLYIDLNSGKNIMNGKDPKSGKDIIKHTPLPTEVETPILNMDGFIFITDTMGKAYAIDETNQQIKWQYEGTGHKTTAPFLFNGIVHYGTDEGVVYAVGRNEDVNIYASLMTKTDEIIRNRTGFTQARMLYNVPSGIIPNGTLRRVYNLNDPVTSSPSFENDFLYIGASNKFYSLRTDSDQIRWTYEAPGNITTDPFVVNRQVFFASENGTMLSVNADNKDNVLWRYPLNTNLHSSPYFSEESIYFGADDKNIYSLSNQGNIRWKFATGNKVTAMPVVYNKILYCGSNDGYVYALSAISGDLIWKTKLGSAILSSPAIAGGHIYIGDSNGKMSCLDLDKGTKIWEFMSGSSIESIPALSDNKVVFTSKDKNIYALDNKTGKKVWSFSSQKEIVSSPAIVDDYV